MSAGASDGVPSVEAPLAKRRLWLRLRQPADEPALNQMARSLAVSANLCATILPGDDTGFAIVGPGGELIGAGSCGPTGLGTGVEVTLWIAESHWDRGLGTEAAQALIDHVFLNATVETVWCVSRATNPRGRRVVEKCGFQFRGTGMVRLPGRGAFPIERFALDRRSWTSLKAWGAAHGPAGQRATREAAAC